MIKFIINATRILFLGVFIWLMIKGSPVVWLGIFGISLLLALLFGRIYCGWICPMNTIMIPTEWLSKKLNLQSKDTPKWLKSGFIPLAMLIILVLTMSLLQKLIGIQIPILLYVLLLSVVVTLRYKPEVFHNNICPFGPLQSLTGRFTRLTEKVNYDKCIGCKLCETVCPSKAVIVSEQDKKAKINPSLCYQCFNCQLICPKDAINYGNKKGEKNNENI